MKKILLLLMSVLIIGWMCRTTIHADDYESLNYINPSLFTEFSVDEAYYDMYAQLEVGPSGFVPIKSGVEYFFMPTYVNKQTNLHALDWSALPQFDHAPQIELFDENHASLGLLTPLKTLSSMGIAREWGCLY